MAAVAHNGVSVQHTTTDYTTTGRVYVKRVIWSETSNAAHSIKVANSNGKEYLPAIVCGAADDVTGPLTFELGHWMDGIVTTMGSGKATYILD